MSIYTWLVCLLIGGFLWWFLPIIYRTFRYSSLERSRQAFERGSLEEAKEFAELALEFARDNLERSFALEELGRIHRFQGASREAIDCYRQALKLREQNLPSGHPDIASACGNLGTALLGNGEVREGELLLRKSYENVRANPAAEKQLLAHVLMKLGQACAYAGKLDESAVLLDESLLLTREEYGDLHERTAEALLTLATSAHIAGQYERANRAFQESRACTVQIHGERHVNALVNMQVHAQLHIAWARLKHHKYALAEADKLATAMVSGLEETVGRGHYLNAIGAAVLARVRNLQQRHSEALKLATEAVETGQATIGPDHLGVSYCHIVLAHALDDLNRIPEAREQALLALAIVQKSLGSDHFDNGDALELLGRLAHREGKHAEAEEFLRRSLALGEPLGPQHPVRAFVLRELAPVLQSLGRADEAAACRREEQAIIAAAR